MSTFCADSAHWHFYNNKRLIKHALFIPRVHSNVLAKQISSLLLNSRLERWKKKKKKKNIFFFNLGATAHSRNNATSTNGTDLYIYTENRKGK